MPVTAPNIVPGAFVVLAMPLKPDCGPGTTTPANAVLSKQVPTFVARCWKRHASFASKSSPGWILVGVNRVFPKTTGAVKNRLRWGVKPYPNCSRNAACESELLERPKTPLSKLHSPLEFVGVANPNTGPCPSANADQGKANTTTANSAVRFMIPPVLRHTTAYLRECNNRKLRF